MLIKSDKVLKYKITLLNIKLSLLNEWDLINISSFMTTVMTNNEELLIYQIIDWILHANYTHSFMQSFRNLAQLIEFKEWKIDNNLVIKYNKPVISNVNNL